MSDAEVLRLARRVSVAEIEGEAVVLDLASGRYFTVNRSGAVALTLNSGAS